MTSMLAAIAKAAGLDHVDEPAGHEAPNDMSTGGSELPLDLAAMVPSRPETEPVAEATRLHHADARGLADAAMAYQSRMAAAGHTVSAAAAVAAVSARQSVQKAKLKAADAPTPATVAAFYADVSATWKSSPSVQKGYANFVAYQTSREIAFCRENAVGLEQLRGETDVPGSFLNRVTPFGCSLSGEAVAKVNAAHVSWLASADLRREFISFDAYARHVLSNSRS